MEEKTELENVEKVTYGKLKRVVKKLKEIGMKDDDEVSFEYVVGSCFPNAYNNIIEEMRRQYTMGYIQGREENSITEEMS